jgi:hypothetical protein
VTIRIGQILAAIAGVAVCLPVIVVGGGFILLRAYSEHCDVEITRQDTAVRIAREYFLSRSIAKFEAGKKWEQNQARYMRVAGLTETPYRRLFAEAEPGRSRKVGGRWCGQPLVHYSVRESIAYGGFEVYFTLMEPTTDPMKWRSIDTGVNVTKCGNIGAHIGTHQHPVEGAVLENFSRCPDAE